MTPHNTELTILSTTIRQDDQGRYSLSDCWKVSGKDKNNQPSKWFEAEKTQEFLRVLGGDPENRATPVSLVTTGPNDGRGYWADRKAVIHYATWISPDFYLTVISAFDALVTGQIPATPQTKRIRKPAFDTAFTRCMNVVALLPNVDENQKVLMAARGTQNLCGINPLEVMGYTALPAQTQDNYMTPTELGKEVGLSGRRVNQILSEEAHLQVHTPGSASGSDWSMTEKGLPYGKMFDSTRRGGKGSQQQLKWKPSAVEFLRPFAAPSA